MRRSVRLAVLAAAGLAASAMGQSINPVPGFATPADASFAHPGALVYEGLLVYLGTPVDGEVDMVVTAWDRPMGGAALDGPTEYEGVLVENGWFRLELEPTLLERGRGFAWLEVSVRWPSGLGEYAALDGRQRLDFGSVVYVPGDEGGGSARGGEADDAGERVGVRGRASAPIAPGRRIVSGVTPGDARDPGRGRPAGWTGVGGDGSEGGGGQRACDWTIVGNNVYYECGNVGIGTTNPQHRLHVFTDGQRALMASNTQTASDQVYYGVWGQSASPTGRGVQGFATAATGSSYGVYARSNGTTGRGVYGLAFSATGTNYGVYGQTNSPDGYAGYFVGGKNHFEGPVGIGVTNPVRLLDVRGGGAITTFSRTTNASGRGVYGWASSATGVNHGLFGQSDSTSGRGTSGLASASSGTTYGVFGQADSTTGAGVYGFAPSSSGFNYGVRGDSQSNSGRGVFGFATASSGTTKGVEGQSNSTGGRGVLGAVNSANANARGVMGQATSPAVAVYADGDTVATGTKSFEIDHPLDPANRYLRHFCTEGHEPLNAYSGNAALDAAGQAWVELPEYFEALNRDFRYQLTTIGGWAPVFVALKIENNRFMIAGGPPGMEVSWRVEGVRNDAYVRAYGASAERAKPEELRGKYLHPELFGRPKADGINYTPPAVEAGAWESGEQP
ncbi:MAG: hypothetical protein KIS87_03070 [Phycisphaeraceae bacterium]|nr:hypothetical protein [Phycisphaeraceae bacterium]